MTSYGTTTYTDPGDYRANVPGAAVDLTLTSSDAFKARVTWIKLRRLTLVTIEEAAPRIAFLSLDPAQIFISFPLQGEPVWDGVRLRRGDFMLHSSGQRLHQMTESSLRWGLISMPAKVVATYGRTLVGRDLTPPETARLLRPAWKTTAEILRLHVHACRLAATKPDMLAYREVVRSVEQELIPALVNMLSKTKSRSHSEVGKRRAAVMLLFEDALAAHPQQLRLPILCATMGVPQRTLRTYCKALLACGPLGVHADSTLEPGALSSFKGQLRNGQRRRSRQAPRLPRSRSLCRRLSRSVRRNAVGHLTPHFCRICIVAKSPMAEVSAGSVATRTSLP